MSNDGSRVIIKIELFTPAIRFNQSSESDVLNSLRKRLKQLVNNLHAGSITMKDTECTVRENFASEIVKALADNNLEWYKTLRVIQGTPNVRIHVEFISDGEFFGNGSFLTLVADALKKHITKRTSPFKKAFTGSKKPSMDMVLKSKRGTKHFQIYN